MRDLSFGLNFFEARDLGLRFTGQAKNLLDRSHTSYTFIISMSIHGKNMNTRPFIKLLQTLTSLCPSPAPLFVSFCCILLSSACSGSSGKQNHDGSGSPKPVPVAQNLRASLSISNDGNYDIVWEGSGAVHYEMEESRDGGISWSSIVRDAPAQSEQSFTKDSPSGHLHRLRSKYSYRVRACNSSDAADDSSCSPWSRGLDLIHLKLAKVEALHLNNGSDGDGNYDLDWDIVEQAERYEIQEKQNGTRIDSPAFRSIESGVTANSHILSNKAGHGSYEYRIRACVRDSGAMDEHCGDWSEPSDSVQVVLPTPDNLLSEGNPSYDGQYRIRWDALSASYSYRISYELEEKPASESWSAPPARFTMLMTPLRIFVKMQERSTTIV